MDFGFFLRGITGIIFNPSRYWQNLNPDRQTVTQIRNSYLFPLLILVTLSAFLGSYLFTNEKMQATYSVMTAIKCFAAYVVSVYLTMYIINEITYPLDLGKNTAVSFSLIVFSITPLLLCQIISRLFETLQFVNILSLYGLYIFWTGAERYLNPPHYKKGPLLVAVFLTFTGIFIATYIVFGLFADRIYFALFD
jgi:hypothetical protein